MQVFQPSPAQFGLTLKHVRLGGSEHAVQPPQHRQRQDDILVLPPLEGVPNQVRDPPDEVGNLTVVHLLITRTGIIQLSRWLNRFLNDAGHCFSQFYEQCGWRGEKPVKGGIDDDIYIPRLPRWTLHCKGCHRLVGGVHHSFRSLSPPLADLLAQAGGLFFRAGWRRHFLTPRSIVMVPLFYTAG